MDGVTARARDAAVTIKLIDLPAHKQTRDWILSEIRYQEAGGVHTYCNCHHCGKRSRGGCCIDCWREALRQLEAL